MPEFFRSTFSENIFNHKYKHEGAETWDKLADTLVEDVCRDYIAKEDKEELKKIITNMEFIPAGRYLYYAGRPHKFFNNCYLLRSEEDSREDWAQLSWKSEMCLMTGGGIGNDYSIYRPRGSKIKKTGGIASGPISKMKMINEIGREVMQGGSRRSAIYASLNWQHGDAENFLYCKDWHNMKIGDTNFAELKEKDFNFPAPLDMTNISLNYDNKFLESIYGDNAKHIYENKSIGQSISGKIPQTFIDNCKQACKTGEPGFSFNFYDKEKETLRNACTEVTSEDDSDVCNLGSINLANIHSIERMKEVVELSSKFLLCGTMVADLPYDKVKTVREKNRRLGLGLMGVHEWLLKRGYQYEVTDELHEWLKTYKFFSKRSADKLADEMGISKPVAYRAIAPTGSIGILAGTTTGIEPIFAVAYKRRYLKGDKDWHYEYVVDSTAKVVAEQAGVDPNEIESAIQLAKDPERRIKFQADIQDYVDMSISSTINLPAWGTEYNNEDKVEEFATILAKYAHRLRGMTVYPNGARGGQPLTSVPYDTANKLKGEVFKEMSHDICDITGHGGSCGE